MKTLALLLLSPLFAQEDDWKQLQEAWKGITQYKTDVSDKGVDDRFLGIAAKVHKAFDPKSKSSLPVDELGLLKSVFQARMSHLVDKMAEAMQKNSGLNGRIRVVVRGFGRGEEDKKVDVPKELKNMEKGFAAGDAKGFKKAFKALQKLKAIDPKIPGWKKRRLEKLLRALAAGKKYPALAVPDEETMTRIEGLITKLGSESMEDRDAATKALQDLGELAIPALRKSAESHEDPEVRVRCRAILGN